MLFALKKHEQLLTPLNITKSQENTLLFEKSAFYLENRFASTLMIF